MTFQKGCIPWHKGKKIGSKSPRWNPDRNSYFVLHNWVVEQLGKPLKCETCLTTSAKRFDWANISGKYKRNLKDWKRLCRSCHLKLDYTEERKIKLVQSTLKSQGIDHYRKIGRRGLITKHSL